MAKVDKVKRVEVVSLDAAGVKPDANGMLRAPVTLTRTGVFTYRTEDGIRRELRTADEVFNADSMDSFELTPFVDEHPYAENGEVTASNAKRLIGGSVGKVHRNGNKLEAVVMVTDEAMVGKILAGKTAVSAGYYCDREWSPGVTADGQEYDCIQRNIRANHVALVQAGRAGPEARIRLDADEGILVSDETKQPNKEAKKMEKMTLDGIPAEMPAQSVAIVAKAMGDRDAKISTQAAQVTKLTSDVSEVTKERDSLKGERDVLKGELAKANDPAKFSAAVTARVGLESKARGIMGADFKMDALDERAIKAACIGKTNPDLKLDGQPDAYVNAVFDLASAKPAAKSNAATEVVAAQVQRAVVAPATTDSADDGDPLKQMLADFHKRAE